MDKRSVYRNKRLKNWNLYHDRRKKYFTVTISYQRQLFTNQGVRVWQTASRESQSTKNMNTWNIFDIIARSSQWKTNEELNEHNPANQKRCFKVHTELCSFRCEPARVSCLLRSQNAEKGSQSIISTRLWSARIKIDRNSHGIIVTLFSWRFLKRRKSLDSFSHFRGNSQYTWAVDDVVFHRCVWWNSGI